MAADNHKIYLDRGAKGLQTRLLFTMVGAKSKLCDFKDQPSADEYKE
jgi:hypothetical protein